MARLTNVSIDTSALRHNVSRVRQCAVRQKVMAMVKANAYGCGMPVVVNALQGYVDGFGVACFEEGVSLRTVDTEHPCLLLEGVFSQDELPLLIAHHLDCVVHHRLQLDWILQTPLSTPIKVWIKVDTGMHRLGFPPQDVSEVLSLLRACAWVDDDIGLMTHLAQADEPHHGVNEQQIRCFNELSRSWPMPKSIANSAAILALPDAHADVVRPGIMLYGVSPFTNQIGTDCGLLPVMHFSSFVMAIHHYPPNSPIGYHGVWRSDKPSIIAVVAAGYGDGYPRHVSADTPTFVKGYRAPVVGRISMDMLTIDITDCPEVRDGDKVELWGQHIPVETIAEGAGTIAYELMCQVTARARHQF